MPARTIVTLAAGYVLAAVAAREAVRQHRRWRGMLNYAVDLGRERDALRSRITEAVAEGRIPIPAAVAVDLDAPLVLGGGPSLGKVYPGRAR